MNIDHMRAFLEVVATGNFQLAAEKLHITQSTVSARIKVLEEQLNRTLFIRKRNGSELTAGGNDFYRHALTVVRAWERALQEASLPEDFKAIVNLGIQLNHWEYFANAWLNWMEQHEPNVATQVISDFSKPLMDRLMDGLIDFAILYDPQKKAGLTIELFMSEKLILVSTKPRSIENSRVDGYVFVDWGMTFRTQHNLVFPSLPAPKLSVGLSDVGLKHILKHGGSGYFLEDSILELVQEKKLFFVKKAPVFQRPTYLVYKEGMSDKKLVLRAINGLKLMANKNKTYNNEDY